jgi:hypothetical protein
VVTSNVNWPEWWQWEVDCSNPHLLKRMLDRSFSETNLREMLETATGYRQTPLPDASSSKRFATANRGK